MNMSPVMPTYARYPVAFERGEGMWLYDTNGRRYMDALTGIAVTGLGHAHPAVTKAICEQAGKLVHTSNLYEIAYQQELGQKLCQESGMEAVYFCNSGAESNEAQIKLARKYGNERGVNNPCIIVMEQSFHGRTLATLSATGNRAIQAGFEPLVTGFVRVPFDDIEAVRKVAENNQSVVAVLVEPVQGEGGVHVPKEGYLKALREICDQHNWLLMLDEVQTGNGRTGTYFAFQQEGIIPDVLSTAKGLGNGMPIGACLARGEAAKVLGPGSHGSTYGGNPLVCAAALAVFDTIKSDKLAENAATRGAWIRQALREKLADVPQLVEVRGKGLMIGVQFNETITELGKLALDNQLLLNINGGGKVIRLLPPLIISEAEAQELVDRVSDLVKQLFASKQN
ncbi:MAG TPA: aspartate aminotransferase family protein [Marinobacterium sp.]|nr:aspartate aminotransferase family protein [Marinobacterium sp.]